MLEPIDGSPQGVLALRGVGKVSAEDIAAAIEPALKDAAATHHALRLVLDLGRSFKGFTRSAVAHDMRLWWNHLPQWERLAIVSNRRRVTATFQALSPFFPGEVRIFDEEDIDAAMTWAATPPA
jgi:hypothetical protein